MLGSAKFKKLYGQPQQDAVRSYLGEIEVSTLAEAIAFSMSMASALGVRAREAVAQGRLHLPVSMMTLHWCLKEHTRRSSVGCFAALGGLLLVDPSESDACRGFLRKAGEDILESQWTVDLKSDQELVDDSNAPRWIGNLIYAPALAKQEDALVKFFSQNFGRSHVAFDGELCSLFFDRAKEASLGEPIPEARYFLARSIDLACQAGGVGIPLGEDEFASLARAVSGAWVAVAEAVPGTVVGHMCRAACEWERFDGPLPEGSGESVAASFEACYPSLDDSTPEISRARARFMALDWKRLPPSGRLEASLSYCQGLLLAADPATGAPLPGELARVLPMLEQGGRDRGPVAKATTFLCSPIAAQAWGSLSDADRKASVEFLREQAADRWLGKDWMLAQALSLEALDIAASAGLAPSRKAPRV